MDLSVPQAVRANYRWLGQWFSPTRVSAPRQCSRDQGSSPRRLLMAPRSPVAKVTRQVLHRVRVLKFCADSSRGFVLS